jgi:hypothetical protein
MYHDHGGKLSGKQNQSKLKSWALSGFFPGEGKKFPGVHKKTIKRLFFLKKV